MGKMTLEELLNKLIKKGWIPFGIYGNGDLEGERICIEEQDEYTNEYRLKVYYINVDYVKFNGLFDEDKNFSDRFSLREIVSKGSGLWQFVCENGMVNYHKIDRVKNIEIWSDKMETELNYGSSDYQARIIESALCDEDKLEEFLLNSIKLD